MTPLDRIQFSQCGEFLYGEACSGLLYRDSRKFEMVPIKHLLLQMKGHIRSQLEVRLKEDGHPDNALQTMTLPSVESTPPATVRMNSIVFNATRTGQQVSLLRKCNNKGKIVFRTLDDNGIEEEHCLSHLPRSSTVTNSEATLLSNFNGNTSLGLVLNKPAQETYSLSEKDDIALPLLITRRIETITTTRCKRRLDTYASGQPIKRRRTNLLAPDTISSLRDN